MKTIQKFFEYVVSHWSILGPALLGLLEAIIRSLPTTKNYSLLDFIYKVLSKTVPNNRKPDGTERGIEYDEEGNQKNKVSVRSDKHIITILFILCGSTLFAQNPNNQFVATYYTDPGAVDTTNVKNTRAAIAAINGNTGGIMFDKTNNKYRVWNPALGIWVDWNLFNSGGVGSNFWKLSGTSTLTSDVNIFPDITAARALLFGNTGNRFSNINLFADNTLNMESGGGDFFVQVGGNVQLRSLNEYVQITTAGTQRLRVQSDGSWTINNTDGVAGQALISNGAASTPTWQTVSPVLTASNGLSIVGSDVRFGGSTISANTTILPATNQNMIWGATGNRFFQYQTWAEALNFDALTSVNIQRGVQSIAMSGTTTAINAGAAGVVNISAPSGINLQNNTAITGTATISSLTATRIPYVGTAGLLTDESTLTYDAGNNLMLVDNIAANGSTTLGIGGAGNTQIVGDNLVLINTLGNVVTFDADGSWNMAGTTPGTTGQVLTSNGASSPPTWQTSGVSGSYTPTLTNTANITSSTASAVIYSRTGNVVTLSGRFLVTPTATTTNTVLSISLPIASNFATNTDCSGVANPNENDDFPAVIEADSTTDLIRVSWITGAAVDAVFYFFTCQYTVI